jgi:hypothetical protein
MTREERMREIFNSKECDERKLIAYQHVVIEELAEQNRSTQNLLFAALNKLDSTGV